MSQFGISDDSIHSCPFFDIIEFMSNQEISNEDKLIFLCAKMKVDNFAQQEIKKLLDKSLNWGNVIERAKRHQILTFLYYNFTKSNLSNIIPKDAFTILKNSYYSNLNRNTILWNEFFSVLEFINRARFNVILLKGVILTETIYNSNPALRTMMDIDILVKETEMLKVKNLLQQLGYQENLKDFTTKKYHQKYKISFDFYKQILPNLSLFIEVHRALAPGRPYKTTLPYLWERIQEKTINNQRVTFLSPEDTFLSLALHLRQNTRHLLLKFICDIAELLNIYGEHFDWKYIESETKRNHIITIIYFSLYISKELLNASIPSDAFDSFKLKKIKDKLLRLCMNKHNFLRPKIWQGYILRLLFFDRTVDFLLYLWQVSFLERFIVKQSFKRIIKKRIMIHDKEITKK